jgi:fibro-slime domain-containing protein
MIQQPNKNTGAVLIISTLVVTAILLTIIVSMVLTAFENNYAVKSFVSSLQTFYVAQSGVEEALVELRLDPSVSSFTPLTIQDATSATQLTGSQATCLQDPQCQYDPGDGWWAEYFNYSKNDPDMEDNALWGATPNPLLHYWYDDTYKKFDRIDASIDFGDDWFPFDGTAWENKEGYAHDYHYGVHWRAKVNAPTSGQYSYALSSDDDSWVLANDVIVVNNSGVHANFTKTGTIYLSQGDNIIDIYFAERHTTAAGFNFHFDDSNLIVTPWPEVCDDQSECTSILETNATSTQATRKVEYSCTQLLSSCQWKELTPGS